MHLSQLSLDGEQILQLSTNSTHVGGVVAVVVNSVVGLSVDTGCSGVDADVVILARLPMTALISSCHRA